MARARPRLSHDPGGGGQVRQGNAIALKPGMPALGRRHIVVGQYLGFALLVVLSLPGFLGGLLLPRSWIGLLGVVPILRRRGDRHPGAG